ncbi:phosphomannomutase/phosphoglucomutase [Phycisphaera mikurensis]|uniref:Phosphoglucomutase/phosphomannomutase n=1 Tax=Phycisphaera mikurensis (strain NBRC 102666 / KCTC 22515 / FYK2301M01) TaxID=1142394 RepID=I0IBT2_PHYMF|nr:phosphomannomutase/phosphoglucomutase [Phycisphaera mikurensis]MBB6442051.1 phosphomannomutase [Phycisphaera mikurensis]BAM02720.1 phosphoglucomutase/phosphomannomutase [Phycisphaera mikurensis NBRC 102666]
MPHPHIAKVFKAYDVRALYPDPLDEPIAEKIGYGVGVFLKKGNGGEKGTVVVSRDHRPAAPSMAEALIRGIRAAGMDVVDLGSCDTSIQYFAVPHLGAAGGVQCTASHNPIEYIGFKVSAKGARPVGRDTGLAEIQATAEGLDDGFLAGKEQGSYEERDIWEAYRKHILQFLTGGIQRPLKLFVDASNGMGTTLLEKVFTGVPNLEIVSINAEYTDDWAHEPNPLVPENMQPTVEGVKRTGADLGACFDGDADRCMLVDDQGNLCGCDHLTAWMAGHFVSRSATDPGTADPTTIVYDLRSSKVVEETVRGLGAIPAMSKVGHVNMKALLRETGGVFGGELSGHFYFRDNSYADSGAITLAAALTVLGQNDQKLSELIGPYRKYPQSGEINFKNDDKQGTIDKLEASFKDRAKEILHLDGVSIDCWDDCGYWFNVRSSNTEPLLRLNAEAKDEAKLKALMDELMPQMGTVDAGH